VGLTLKPYLESRYLTRRRQFRYKGLHLEVEPGVFHPGLFFSSKFLAGFLEKLDLRNKSVLEMGSGSGLLSLVAARQGACVCAVDISPLAVDTTTANALNNGLTVAVQQSDLFSNIQPQRFDLIVVNPPYFRGQAADIARHAWYCGDNLEYFHGLFCAASSFMGPDGVMYMVLSDDCEVAEITAIAKTNGFDFTEKARKHFFFEDNFVLAFYPAPAAQLGDDVTGSPLAVA